jgi:hypothetical protein
MTDTDTERAGAALRLAAHGWPVLPCHTPTSAHCSCGASDCSSPGKHPRTAHGLSEATTDRRVVAQWWRRWPTANLAVRTGALPSGAGVVVLDIDRDAGGERSLEQLTLLRGQLPPTLEASSGGGGRHLYFAHPGRTIPNSAGRLGDGIDVRSDGGYILVSPSVHRSGGRYRWANDLAPSGAPEWLLELMDPPRPPQVPMTVDRAREVATHTRWATAALDGEVTAVRRAPEGCRNHSLNRAAFALGQLVAAGHLDEHQVVGELTAAGLASGLGEREVHRTIASGFGAGLEHPRHPARR